MSDSIVPFIVDRSSFDSDATAAMGTAYDTAIRLLGDTRQPGLVNEAVALRIIELFKSGVRDADRMAFGALEAFGLKAG